MAEDKALCCASGVLPLRDVGARELRMACCSRCSEPLSEVPPVDRRGTDKAGPNDFLFEQPASLRSMYSGWTASQKDKESVLTGFLGFECTNPSTPATSPPHHPAPTAHALGVISDVHLDVRTHGTQKDHAHSTFPNPQGSPNKNKKAKKHVRRDVRDVRPRCASPTPRPPRRLRRPATPGRPGGIVSV